MGSPSGIRRLFEEGIEDLHGLVTANLVDVILGTRIPVDRLVDWLDQALLYLHVPAESSKRLPRDELRALGIRTATDLERAWESTDREAAAVRQQLAETVTSGNRSGVAVIEMVLASLRATSSFLHVQRFKRHEWLADEPPAKAA